MSHLGDRLTAFVDGRLTVAEHDKVLAHVRHCADCRAAVEHEQWVRQRLHDLPSAEPSAALLMALTGIGGSTAFASLPLSEDPAAHWSLPAGRRAGAALAGAGTVAAGVLGLAYVVGSTPVAEPVRPPVEQFSSEFAGADDPLPFSDPAVDAFTGLARTGSSPASSAGSPASGR